ncbi:redoxin domain-containing protein [uncultured Paludibaculum sp.]|uniref:redoxin domain-containing protein n=1 Tax=uncultured Paludibaculum sp. TaxID=1765020 RepID=UPI002AAC36E7|nr:redoxin domain-containing protein [uncultured Paludibaculum sp.]
MRLRSNTQPLSRRTFIASLALFQPAPRFLLYDTEGAIHQESEWAQAKAVVLFFVTTDCPLSNGYVPEMNRIAREYAPRGVRVYAVLGDITVPAGEARRHVREFEYRFPVLFDQHQVLARYTGATVTPEAAVLSPHGQLLYLGRIDNSVERIGTTRFRPTKFELREALTATLAGRPVPHPRTTAFGCAISHPE